MGADIREWVKGILFFILTTLMFYFLWTNVFSNIIEFVANDFMNIGANAVQSLAILKTIAWVSFVFLYLAVTGGYLIFSIIAGAKGEIKTEPIYLLIAIGAWSVLMPLLSIIYAVLYTLIATLEGLGTQTSTITNIAGQTITTNLIDAGSLTMASNFSWIFGLITIIILTCVPFYFIIKGYGVNILGEKGASD